MEKIIKARFSNGIIEPLEQLDFEEGDELEIAISLLPKGNNTLEALRATAGGWKDLIDAEELKRNIYSDRLIKNRPEPKL